MLDIIGVSQLHLYFYGEIVNFQSKEAPDWGCFSLKNIVDQINANPDSDEIIGHIHSVGGDVVEAFAIHDYLLGTGKKLTMIVDGLCASAATLIFLTGSVRKMAKNAEFMIHNPWGGVCGEGDEIIRYGESVKKSEEKLLAKYLEFVGTDKEEQIRAYMDEATYIEPAEALELGFATEILEPVFAKAVLPSFTKTHNKMSKTLIQNAKSLLKDIKAFVSGSVKALDVTLESGETLTIETGDSEEPEVGDAVMLDGDTAPDGEYTLSDGRTIVVADGVISEIKPAEEDDDDPEETIENLQAENTRLQARVDEMEANETEMTTVFNSLKKQFDTIKNTRSSYKPKSGKPPISASSKEKTGEGRFAKFKKSAKKD
ncbi:Clp protease ClpP [Pedobacter sp. BS3]|uniref:head maturation protease, ClpP-related n=1 Tax=Pedobacter sp. BS3 TaxID=2567937 RepID=UPI0011EC540B|nr:head maturation protease, ClpP-related [Pedobacter sp. BS3]TZF84517.1 Clp protease ClpP [Pedobacter sp. BS3]